MSVAATNPFGTDPYAALWGWGDPLSATGGVQLRRALTAVADQDPAANVAARRAQNPDLWSETGDARMLALNAHVSRAGDSGGALIRGGVAAAMHWGAGPTRGQRDREAGRPCVRRLVRDRVVAARPVGPLGDHRCEHLEPQPHPPRRTETPQARRGREHPRPGGDDRPDPLPRRRLLQPGTSRRRSRPWSGSAPSRAPSPPDAPAATTATPAPTTPPATPRTARPPCSSPRHPRPASMPPPDAGTSSSGASTPAA